MTSKVLEVVGNNELLALHRGLMEARFCEVPNDPDVSGSPILSEIHRKLVEVIVAGETVRSTEQWRQWLQLSDDRREWNVALDRAIHSTRWKGLDGDEKRKLALDLLSPFDVSEAGLMSFVSAVDARREKLA